MNGESESNAPFQVGRVRVTPALNQISNHEKIETVEPRLMDVLCYLAARHDDVISRSDIIHDVWQVEYGGDDSLSRAISILRKAFRDVGESDDIIETIPRRGYRLLKPPVPVSDQSLVAPSGEAVQEPETTPLVTQNTGEQNSRPERVFQNPASLAPLMFFISAALFAVLSFAAWRGREPAVQHESPPERSLAILPFTALTNSEADRLFAEGLAEEMMARFAIIEDLRMPGRTASRALAENGRDIQSIGEELSVNYVLEGTIRRDKDRMRINVDLSSTESGYRIWSQSYDRAGDESLLIQEDVARRVANALSARFLDNGAELKSLTGTTSGRAYNLYLEGRRYLNMRGGAVARAIERFETALEEDPEFGRAAAALASAHAISSRNLNTPKAIARSRAKMYADLARNIDDTIAESFAVRGAIARDEQRWTEANTFFDEAYQRDPTDLPSLHGRIETLISLGYLQSAESLLDEAIAIDPVSPVSHYLAGHVALAADDLDTADEHYRRAQALGFGGAVFDRGLVLFRRGEIEKAADLLATAYVHYQLISDTDLERLSEALERLMRRQSTVEIELRDFPTLTGDDDARMLAFLLAGETDRALNTLKEDADGDHDGFHHIWTNLAPEIRTGAAFTDFAEKTGLMDYWGVKGWPDKCQPRQSNRLICQN